MQTGCHDIRCVSTLAARRGQNFTTRAVKDLNAGEEVRGKGAVVLSSYGPRPSLAVQPISFITNSLHRTSQLAKHFSLAALPI